MPFATIGLSYVYKEELPWERYQIACEASGWPKAIMLTQIVHTFGATQLKYYQAAAELDAKARGFEQHQGEHFRLLRDWEKLPPYKEARPTFDPSMLDAMPQPDSGLERASFSRFKCSARNSAILHLAVLIEQTNIQKVMTKLMRWYYTHYWDGRYTLQLAADEQATISPVTST